MREHLPTGTVTFLFTDVEGSTRLLHELGPEAYAEALATHRIVLRRAFAEHGGVEVDTQGDALFYAFPTAPGALEAAREAQEALEAGPIDVRMGIHTGTPLLAEEGYVGEDVHLGARIAASAHGGQVVCSRATRELVGLELADLGEHRLKDIAQPVSVYQVGEERFPPPNTLSNTNLPSPASSFVGREREVSEVLALVRSGARLVTLTGAGGSGKTRLSIEVGSELVVDFRNAVVWIPLATVRDPVSVPEAIAQALGASDGLVDHVGRRELLLLLDNFEQVVEAAPELSALLTSCPGLRLLATSRVLLRIDGEVEYAVPPLVADEAVELFCSRAGMESDEAVADLCRRLDSLPLAVELAAARTKVLTPEQIIERLSQRLDLLKGGRDADPRQQTLRATIAWSYELLTPEEQVLFTRLAVFAGGCTLEDVEEVCEADLDTLQSLVEKSLARFTEGRYWMLETIREYGLERLDASADGEVLRRRHAEHVLALAWSANLGFYATGEQRFGVAIAEQDNIRTALTWALAHGETVLGLELMIALTYFWFTNHPEEGARWFANLLAESPAMPDDTRLRVLLAYGDVSYAGDPRLSAVLYDEALALARALDDERAVAAALAFLANQAFEEGDFAQADRLMAESTDSCETPDPATEVWNLELAARLARLRDRDFDRARRLYEHAIDVARRAGLAFWEAEEARELGLLECDAGAFESAEAHVRNALERQQEFGQRAGILGCLGSLAWIARRAGNAERAGVLWGAVEAEELRASARWAIDHGLWEARVVADGGPDFERGRRVGSRMSLEQTVEHALAPVD